MRLLLQKVGAFRDIKRETLSQIIRVSETLGRFESKELKRFFINNNFSGCMRILEMLELKNPSLMKNLRMLERLYNEIRFIIDEGLLI